MNKLFAATDHDPRANMTKRREFYSKNLQLVSCHLIHPKNMVGVLNTKWFCHRQPKISLHGSMTQSRAMLNGLSLLSNLAFFSLLEKKDRPGKHFFFYLTETFRKLLWRETSKFGQKLLISKFVPLLKRQRRLIDGPDRPQTKQVIAFSIRRLVNACSKNVWSRSADKQHESIKNRSFKVNDMRNDIIQN